MGQLYRKSRKRLGGLLPGVCFGLYVIELSDQAIKLYVIFSFSGLGLECT